MVEAFSIRSATPADIYAIFGMVRELAYTGRRLRADRALEIGLVNQLWSDHTSLLEGVMEIAREIASNSQDTAIASNHNN